MRHLAPSSTEVCDVVHLSDRSSQHMNAIVLWMLVMQLGQEVPAGNPQVILVQDIVSKEACERLGQTLLQRLKVSNTIAFCAPVEKAQAK